MNIYSYVCFYYSTSDAIVNGKLKKIKKICPSDFFDFCGGQAAKILHFCEVRNFFAYRL